MKKRDQKYCTFPFENVEIHEGGDLYFCCPNWQKKPFGNCNSGSILDAWNSDAAQEIRASIIDGSYKYCNSMCPHLQAGSLSDFSNLKPEQKLFFSSNQTFLNIPPSRLMLCYDRSCNLSCESCRTQKILHGAESEQYKSYKKFTDQIIKDFFSFSSDNEIRLNITGSGDPFASVTYRQFLENLDGSHFPKLKIDFQTNGVLFGPQMWDRLDKIRSNIGEIYVSVDAATEKTYRLVRRGGNWQQLLSNIEFLKSLRLKKEIDFLQVNFIVQQRNYLEMIDFVKMFNKKGIDSISFSLIDDWTTWNVRDYNKHAVWKSKHNEFSNFMKILADPVFNNPKIFLGNLTPFRPKASQAKHRLTNFFAKFLLIKVLKNDEDIN